jgi:hypothetical protein
MGNKLGFGLYSTFDRFLHPERQLTFTTIHGVMKTGTWRGKASTRCIGERSSSLLPLGLLLFGFLIEFVWPCCLSRGSMTSAWMGKEGKNGWHE